MVTRNSNRLEIFDSFEIDRSLPKYNKGEKVDLVGSIPTGNVFNGNNGSSFFISTQGTATTGNWGTITTVPMNSWDDDEVAWSDLKTEKPSVWEKFSFWKKDKKVVAEKKKTMTILNFFSSLAQSLNDLKTLQDIGIHYETAISNAAKAGQTALVDKLKLRLESAKSEIQLVTMGLKQYLTEEQIVDFYNASTKDKNLKLTWIKHFVKPIPSKVLDIKAQLDSQFVFDNYVILHYDPNNDATDLTKVEKEERVKREKDPILFGVIKDSRRLYYVADWIDDYCNLTLDTVIETLQEKVGEINNETVKTYIDLGLRKEQREKLQKKEEFPPSATAMTVQMPTTFEKVRKEIVMRPKRVIDKIFKRTSSAKELSKHLKENKKKK